MVRVSARTYVRVTSAIIASMAGWVLLLWFLTGMIPQADAGESGPTLAAPKTLLGYWHQRFILADTAGISVVDSLFSAAGVPTDSAFVDTLFIARDLNGDGDIDSVGVSSDYLPMTRLDVTAVTLGPDTLWFRALDDSGFVVQSWSIVTGTAAAGTKGHYQWSIPIAAPRVAYAVGSTGYADRWELYAYFQRR